MSRARRWLIAAAVVLLLAAGGYLGYVLATGSPLFGSLSLVRSRRTEVSHVVLESARRVYRLSTAEYIIKTVFPYDYMPEDMSIERIIRKVRASAGSSSVAAALDDTERTYLEAYNLAREAGIAMGPDRYQFVVVESRVRAGYDLENVADADLVSQADGRTIVHLPEARITAVEISDPSSGDYPYPDIELSPAFWREIAAFVAAHAGERAVAEGILSEARARARQLFETVLGQSDFDNVVMSE